MEYDLTPRNLPNPLNTAFSRPNLLGNQGAFERYEYESPYKTQAKRFAPLQFSPQNGYSLGLADKKLNAALPSTRQRFGNRINYDSDQRKIQKRYGATFQEPYEMGLTRPGTGREPFQEIPYTFLDNNAERYDSIGGKRLGKQTVEQAQRSIMGGSSLGFAQPQERFSLTDGNTSISPQLLKALQAEGFGIDEIFGYFNGFGERQKVKNLLLFIIVILLFGLLIK